MVFHVGDVVVANDRWSKEDIGKRGIVSDITDKGVVVVTMLEEMPEAGVDKGYEWYLGADSWNPFINKPFVCRSLL